MVAAMAGFAVEDMLLKAAAQTIGLGQILLMFGIAGLAGFAVLTRRQGRPIWDRAYLGRAILIRSVFEVTGRIFYALAFVMTPLTSATAILQATPLVVVGGAAIFLGERVGWRRWTAILVGLGGVMMILRPGLEGFSPLSILAVIGMIGFAGRDLATRAAPPQLSAMQLGICGFAMLSVAGAILMIWTGGPVVPDLPAYAFVSAATVFGVFAYFMLTLAMRTGEVGAVTPFRYSRLLFGMGLGVLVFGERPDLLTILGALVIAFSGTFALLRARRV